MCILNVFNTVLQEMHLIYVLYLSVAYFRHLLFSCCSATFQASADVSSFSCTGKAYLLAFDSFLIHI